MPSQPIRIMDFRGTYKGGGGPDKTILNSAAQHDPLRVYVLVAYLKQPNDEEFQIAAMAKSLALNYVDVIDRNMFDWSCIRQLKKLIQQEKISLLHSHDDKTLLYSVILKYLIPELRIMHTCHSHPEYAKESFASSKAYWKFRLRKKFLIWLMRQHLKPVLTISENTKQRLIRSGLKPENISVLYNGIDIEYWRRGKANPVLKKELGLSENDLLVGTVARITYDKDLHTFYKTAEILAKSTLNIKFVIVGDGNGNELEKAKQEVTKLGLEKLILFTGHRTDLRNIYASFDLFLMTSRTEGLPNTILEAMAMEIPVVSTHVGGIGELIIDQKTGLLYSVGAFHDLAEGVLLLLKNKEKRSLFAIKSRKQVEENFNFYQRVKLLEGLYLFFDSGPQLPSPLNEGD